MGSAVQDLEEEQRLLMLCLVAASSILCILDTTKLESVQAMSVCQARSLFLRLLTPDRRDMLPSLNAHEAERRVSVTGNPIIVVSIFGVMWC